VRALEQQRAGLWQQAAHDLRGNLGVVATASAGAASVNASGDVRAKFMQLLDRNVTALHDLLDDVTSLARLQGGLEHRALEEMDASPLLRDLCEGLRAQAEQRGLAVRLIGPPTLKVQGDPVKIRRIAQNLILNAVRYTREGSITVQWGGSDPDDGDRWLLEISDTGPGFHAGPDAQLANAIETATDQARQVTADVRAGDVSHVDGEIAEAVAVPQTARTAGQNGGEGIGLSIVKRLCDLLDATVEVESDLGVGTRFRIRLPRAY
jgi:signal transduction histidine kinase